MKKGTEDLLIAIIREELNDSGSLSYEIKEQLNCDELIRLYSLSKSQDLSHIVADALEKAEMLDGSEVSQKFEKQKTLSIFRYMQMDYDLSLICDTLESSNIPYMPLKGSVIRNYYPKPEIRTSCDIDILVSKNNLEKAIEALVSNAEYKVVKKTMHDVSLYSPSNTHLELHHTLSETDAENDFLSEIVWDRAHIEDGTESRYEMDNDVMLAYLVLHTAKHFSAGGCGVRPFMDFYILRKNIDFNFENVKKTLSVYGLETFFDKCMYLTDVWFGNKEHTDLTHNMQDFILNSGVYGNVESRALALRKGQNKIKYVFRRIFLPYSELCNPYKKLKKYPILYPFYTVVRWFRIIFKKRKYAMEELKNGSSASDEKNKQMQYMLSELGL